jgi:hypothetical protein
MKENIEIEFLPVEVVAQYHGVRVESLKTLYYKDYQGKDIRFKKDEKGRLLVNLDYKYPLSSRIEELREIALQTAKSEYRLAHELAKITKKKVDTIQRYFIRFTFKRIQTAKEIIKALETYISQNSIFGMIAI